jgi:hypothetical protein
MIQQYLSRHAPKGMLVRLQKDTFTLIFIAALFTISKLWKQPGCPKIDEWIKKMWYLYTMEFYSEELILRRMKFCCLQVNGCD